MSVPTRFVLQQGPALKGMGEAAVGALKQRLGVSSPEREPALPGPEFTATYPPRDPELVRAYVKHVGGDPGSYKRRVPAHLFPQWGFGLTGKTLEGLNYPMLAAMNGGCKLVQNAPLPIGEPLEVSARLESIDDNGRRAILEQRIVTSTRSAPEAVVAHLYIFVPLGKKSGGSAKNGSAKNGSAKNGSAQDRTAKNGSEERRSKEKPRVPTSARELAFWRLKADAGLDFAKLTGDFNPVHWVPAWARAFGFRNTILHGFGTMARAIEGMNRSLFAGDVDALREVHVRFTRPLVLPAQVGLYVSGNELYVGDAPGGPAYLTGNFVTRD